MNNNELVLLLQQKNESAFKELVTQFQNRVFNTSLALVQNKKDAEDVAQEVFIQVYRSIDQFKNKASLSTWIYRITISKCSEFLRSKKRKKRFGIITQIFGQDNTPIYEQTDFVHPGVQQERKEDSILLFKKVNELPENQRTAFLLNKIEDLSYAEIAGILKVSEAAVDSLLQRAKQNLRKKLAGYKNNSG